MTWGLMAACFAVFVATGVSGEAEQRLATELERKLHQAHRTWSEQPHLEPPKLLAERLHPSWPAIQARARENQALESRTGGSREAVEAEQARLDRLGAELEAILHAHPFFDWGLVPSRPTLRAAISHMFVHADWLHLLGNLFLLFLTGPFIEDRWGRPLFLAFYLAAGLAGAGLFASRFPAAEVPLVGASGAIAGCMGGFLVRFWYAKLHYLFWFGFLVRTFWAPAWVMLPLWFANELVMASATGGVGGDGGGVAYWAHVGGFGFGVVAAWWMARQRIEERFVDPHVERRITLFSNEGVSDALELHAAGQSEKAYEALARQVEAEPDDRDAVQALWDVAASLGRLDEVRSAMLRSLRAELREGDLDGAARHWVEWHQAGLPLGLEAGFAAALAPAVAERGESELAVATLSAALDAGALEASAALRLARAAGGLDADTRARAARCALGDRGASPAERDAAEAMLSELEAAAAAVRTELEEPSGLELAARRPDPSGRHSADGPEMAPAAPVFGDDPLELAAEPGGILRGLRVVEAVPLALDADGLTVELPEGKRRLDRCEAIAVGAVRGLAPKPVLVIDLVLNWMEASTAPLQSIRLRSDRFDPRSLVERPDLTPAMALREMLRRLLVHFDAFPLPDAAAAAGEPRFGMHPDLVTYARAVLQATAEGLDAPSHRS